MQFRTFGTAQAVPIFLAAVQAAVLLTGLADYASAQDTGTDEDRRIDTIVVVGTQTNIESARAEAALTPGGVSLVDMDEYRERNVSSLADVLRYVPGLWSASSSGNDTIFLSSRGSNLDATDYDMNGIKLMQDGLPITTADGNNHNRVLDPLSTRHATVARGANALKYGASTLGGAINFVSTTARDAAGVDLSLSAGSHGQQLARITAANVFNDRLDGLFTVETKRWDGFREHNEQDRLGLYANVGWQLSKRIESRFYGTWLDNNQELAGSLTRAQMKIDPDQANAAAIGGNYQKNVETWRLANKTSWHIDGNRRLDVGFSIEEQTLFHPIVDRVMVDFDGPGPGAPVEVFSLLIDTDHRDIGAVFRYNHRIEDHDLLFGFNFGRNSADGGNFRNLGGTPNGLTTLVDNDATLLEAFAMDRWQISDRLTLILAAQVVSAQREVRNTDAASGALINLDDRYSSLNPRAGLVYALRDDVTIYANVSRLFEPPTNFELEDNVQDSTLEPMQGTVMEVGTRGSRELGDASSWVWDVALYYAEIEDEILSVEDPSAPGTSLTTNVDSTVHAGIEAMVAATLGLDESANHSIEPLLSVTFNDFRFQGDPEYGDNRLPAAPDYTVRGEIIYRNGNGFHFGPTAEFIGERFADFVNGYKIDSYSLLGFRGGWSNDTWSVYADFVNVLDESYVATHSVRNLASANDAILHPGEPLSAYVGIRRQFR
jgi:iron complex outermembrane recepter protein